MEPAAMLVAPLQIHVGGGGECRVVFQHCRMGDAGIEPHIKDVHLLLEC